MSATPGPYELTSCEGEVVEQLIRPTGLLDPVVEVRPQETQVDDLFDEINKVVEKGGRVLVTTMTKKMSQELSHYYSNLGQKVCYLHSDIDTIERIQILADLRMGTFDVLVGINLLREGLDLPEVQLVAILDADKQGFLRNRTSLIQTIGRAARNKDGRVILYGQRITASMQEAINETHRRRMIQEAFNTEHNIEPKTIVKSIGSPLHAIFGSKEEEKESTTKKDIELTKVPKMITKLRKEMLEASKKLEFEKAIALREQIKELEVYLLRFT